MGREREAWKRAVRRALGAGLIVFTFVAAVVSGVLLHLDVPAARRLVRERVNAALRDLPTARVEVVDLKRLSASWIVARAVDARVGGLGHARFENVRIHVDWVHTLIDTLIEPGIHVEIRRIVVERVDLTLQPGEARSPAGSEGPSRLWLDIDAVEIGQATVRGRLPVGPAGGGPSIDVDFDRLHGSLLLTPARLAVEVSTAGSWRAGVPAPVSFDLDLTSSLPLDPSASTAEDPSGERAVELRVHLRSGDLALSATGSIVRDVIDLEVEVPPAPVPAIRSLLAGWPVQAPVSARARASGTLSRLDVKAQFGVGSGTLEAEGELRLQPAIAFEGRLSGRRLDLGSLFGGPTSNLALGGEFHIRAVDGAGGPVGSVSVRLEPGIIGGQPSPAVVAFASLDASGIHGTATVHEEGAPARVEFARSAEGRLEITGTVEVPSLAAVPRLRRENIGARGRATAQVTASLVNGLLSVRGRIAVDQLGALGIKVHAVRLAIDVEGPWEALDSRWSAEVTGFAAPSVDVAHALLSARGTRDVFDIAVSSRGGTFDALLLEARMELGPAIRVSGLFAQLERLGRSVTVEARSIAVAPESTSVEGLEIEGLGQPIRASGRWSPDTIVARVVAPSFDLGNLAALVSGKLVPWGGRGSIELAIDVRPGSSQVEGYVRVVDGMWGSLPELDFSLDIDLDGRVIQGMLAAQGEGIGAANVVVAATLGGSFLDARSLLAWTGNVVVTADGVSLEAICALSKCPTEIAHVLTNVRPKVSGRVDLTRAPRNGDNDDTRLHVALDARDARGPFAFVETEIRFDFARALADRRFPSDARWKAQVHAGPRSLREWPAQLRPAALLGTVELDARAHGTVAEPVLAVEVAGRGMKYGGIPGGEIPSLDVRWVTTYAGEMLLSHMDVRSDAAAVLRGSLRVDVSLKRLLDREAGPSWKGELELELSGFPLSFVPALADAGVSGTIWGKVSASGLHANPRAWAQMRVEELRVRSEPVGRATVTLAIEQRSCELWLGAFRPSNGTHRHASRASLQGHAACRWIADAIPSVDSGVPAYLMLDATQLPLAALEPLLEGSVERLQGTVDAHLRAKGDPRAGLGSFAVEGEMHVRDGQLFALAIGREIRRLEIDMTATAGRVLNVERMIGESGAGRFTAEGWVALGRGRPERASFEIHVPKRYAVPVTVEGVSYGTVWGDVHATARAVGDQLLFDVKVPTLRGDLPPQLSGDLESLDDNPAVVVLQRRSAVEEGAAVGGGPGEGGKRRLVPVFRFELGNNVGISRDDMKLELGTPPPPANLAVSFDPDLNVTGAIRILGGRVPVAGRVFRVERGIVRFGGDDPANPSLDVDAVYEGAGTSTTRINVHVGGTAKDIKLSLRSSPPKPESELLAILAFGESAPAGGFTSPGRESSTTTAAAAAGSAAAGLGSAVLVAGINQILSQSIIPIRTSVSSGAGASNLATASLELSERVRIGYMRQFGTIQYGRPVDANQFAFDWRFKPRWTLRTVVGDRGTTSLDVLWQRWY